VGLTGKEGKIKRFDFIKEICHNKTKQIKHKNDFSRSYVLSA
jgi:hypothetical protein